MPTEKLKASKSTKELPPLVPETPAEEIDSVAFNLLSKEFSLAEDLLFLRAQQGHGVTIKDLQKKYTEKKKLQPKSYFHPCKPELFRERLLQLPEDKPRARLLELELQRQLALEAEAKADVVEVSAPTIPPLLLQLSSVNDPPCRAHKRNLEQVACVVNSFNCVAVYSLLTLGL
jgi:hypothetical protein